MHRSRENFRVSFVLFSKANHIPRQRKLIDFESKSRPFWVFNEPQVIALLSLSKHQHVRDPELTGSAQKVLDCVFLLLLKSDSSVWVHKVASVIQEFFEELADLATSDNEC